jgi:hypothetical protein
MEHRKKMMIGKMVQKDGNASARREPMTYGGMGMKKKPMQKGGMNRIQYTMGGPVTDNTPIAKAN